MNSSISLSIGIRHLCPPRPTSNTHAFRTFTTAANPQPRVIVPLWRNRNEFRYPVNSNPSQNIPSRGLRTLKRFQTPIPRKTLRIPVPPPAEQASASREIPRDAVEQSVHDAPADIAGPSSVLSTAPQTLNKQPPNLPYYIHRTRTQNLPVYHLAKAGGNRKLTAVQKVKGNSQILLQDLLAVLEPRPKEAWVNSVNGHVVLKGWYREQVAKFLTVKGF